MDSIIMRQYLFILIMSMCLRMPLSARRVVLLTDVEGNWQYVRNVVRQSTCLQLIKSGQEETLELRDDCMLVFGGDAGDKGDHTLKCYEQLVHLKKRHPDRVILLVGNRDVNKMRFTSELSETEINSSFLSKEILEGPEWVPIDKRVTLKEFLIDQLNGKDLDVNDDTIAAANTKANRLKWMLEHTMGAQGDFERRRAELKSRQAVDLTESVPDESVVTSYLNSVEMGGVLREYLLHSSLAYVTHQTLFLHGGIINGNQNASLSALDRVPGESSTHRGSVQEWVDRLNAWYRAQIQEWIRYPTWNENHSSRGGEELLKYVLPDYSGSVVTGRHLLPSGMPTPVSDETASLLSESGIRHVIIGHTPHGNCPTVVKQPHQQYDNCAVDGRSDLKTFESVIMCDTSYSDTHAPDNRGSAASEVVVDNTGHVTINGVLEDGRQISSHPDEDSWVGRWLQDDTMVKARFSDNDEHDEASYLVFRVDNGYSYTYQCRSITELQEIGLKK
ncbi:putative calcineurin-like phosphoesterase domain, ApaH type [Plasmopara halstedii]